MEKIKAQTMDNKINIAEILKDCPMGMKLYSPLLGNVEIFSVSENDIPIRVRISKGRTYDYYDFTSEGLYYVGYYDAECLLFPSREMRDWAKFFKRGDVVYGKNDMYAIFEGWANDDYTKFNTTIGFYEFDASFDMGVVCDTDDCVKASDEERAKFIANAEKHYNGKYNPETLQVEPVKPECPFKSFDKVLVRDCKEREWYANSFSHYRGNDKDFPYACFGNNFRYCIPYNEHTAHLLGTTDPYTEGGSE